MMVHNERNEEAIITMAFKIQQRKGREHMIASIVVDIAAKQVNQTFDYMVPDFLESILKVGYRVRVIFGNRTVMGFVVAIKEKTSFRKKLREISDIVDVYPVLNEEFVELAKFITENNFSYYAVALQTMIPSALKIKYRKTARILEETEELKSIFQGKKEIELDHRSPEELKVIYTAQRQGKVSLDTKLKKNRNEKKFDYIYVKDVTKKPSSRQGEKLLSYLLELEEATPMPMLLEHTGFSKSVIHTLLERGTLGLFTKEVLLSPEPQGISPKAYTLNQTQQACYERVNFEHSKTYLLYGVTGSGKTLLYISWIKDVLAKGRQALLLVPEISLTPQITAIFQSYFGSSVAILHSRLSMFERYSRWKSILQHEVQIVIGARSAVFAPLDNLGIIIIDEEHEPSYIQENNPKYNAIEIAALRSKRHICPLILGSATPNVCDYYKAIEGEYELLHLPNRANQKEMPRKQLVDMTVELKKGNKSVFSNLLKETLLAVFKRKEQSILFLNRRGHSSFVMCRSCGEVVKCPHCDISLTYHSYTNTLECHYCGHKQLNVESCPACGSSKIRFVGSGTEKVMEEIQNLIPEAKVLRVDLDTTKKVIDYEAAFQQFKNHEADIMVGTQMIAKGLDFADVTLVGVINADLALHYPSYDSNMTAFNLIEQVSGRAGRGEKKGEVIIQTYQPKHFVLETALHNDYDGFFKREIENRRITGMPPFSLALVIQIESLDVHLARTEAYRMLQALKDAAKESEILGPAEAFPFRRNDYYRFTIQLKVKEDRILDKIKEIYPLYQNNSNVNIKITKL